MLVALSRTLPGEYHAEKSDVADGSKHDGTVAGCEDEGSAKKAGRQIDEATTSK